GFDGERLRIRVACSKGTYIRVLAEDIGEALGCGAHLSALRRERVGELSIEDAIPLDELVSLDEQSAAARLAPIDALLGKLPAVRGGGPCDSPPRWRVAAPWCSAGAWRPRPGERGRRAGRGWKDRGVSCAGWHAAGARCSRRVASRRATPSRTSSGPYTLAVP